jgi:hypothetical protein
LCENAVETGERVQCRVPENEKDDVGRDECVERNERVEKHEHVEVINMSLAPVEKK